MTKATPLAILGGTFDPVHIGHVESAKAVRDLLHCEVAMIPSQIPPHRVEPCASADHRRAMLEVAIAGMPGVHLDDRELRRPGASYTYDTLAEIRGEVGATRPLVFVLGEDAFATLTDWHQWRAFPELSHLLVLARPDVPSAAAAQVKATLAALTGCAGATSSTDHHSLTSSPCGSVCVKELAQVKVSATQVRQARARGESIAELVPADVQAYIGSMGLYVGDDEVASG